MVGFQNHINDFLKEKKQKMCERFCGALDETTRDLVKSKRPEMTCLFLSPAILYFYDKCAIQWAKRFDCYVEIGVANERVYVCAFRVDDLDTVFTHELIGRYEKSTKSCFYYFRADVSFGFAFSSDCDAAEFEAKLKSVGMKDNGSASELRTFIESKGLRLEANDEEVQRAVSDHLKGDLLIEHGWIFARTSDSRIVIEKPPCAKAGERHHEPQPHADRDLSHLRNLSMGGPFETTDVAIPLEMQARPRYRADDSDVIDLGLDHGPIVGEGGKTEGEEDVPAVFHIVAPREMEPKGGRTKEYTKSLGAAREINPAAHNSFGDLPTVRHVVFGPIYHKPGRSGKDDGESPLAPM